MVDFHRRTTRFPVFIICDGGKLKPEHAVWTDVDGFACLAIYSDLDLAERCVRENGYKGKVQTIPTATELIEALGHLRKFEYVAFDPDLDGKTSYTPMVEFVEELRGLDG